MAERTGEQDETAGTIHTDGRDGETNKTYTQAAATDAQ